MTELIYFVVSPSFFFAVMCLNSFFFFILVIGQSCSTIEKVHVWQAWNSGGNVCFCTFCARPSQLIRVFLLQRRSKEKNMSHYDATQRAWWLMISAMSVLGGLLLIPR